ncbi:MAG: hypothetical protein ACTSPM_04445 [Candidatus Heimdallarchaeota archaeon]
MGVKRKVYYKPIHYLLIFILILFLGFLPLEYTQSNPIPVVLYTAKFEDINQWDVTLSTEGSSLTRDATLNYSFENTGKLIGRTVCYYDFTKNSAGGEPLTFENSRFVEFGWYFTNISSNYVGVMFNYSNTQVYCIANFSGEYSNSSTEYWFLCNDSTNESWYEHYLSLDSFGDQLYGVAIINGGYDNGIDLEPCNQTTNFAYIAIAHVGEGWTPPLAIPIFPIIIGLVIIGITSSKLVIKKSKEKK